MAERPQRAGLVMGSDGLPCLPMGEWAEEKLGYLRWYCDIFSRGMKRKWRRRIYIDLFCGPGRISIRKSQREIEGSPILASQYEFTDYFFNDSDPAALDALRKRIRPRPGVNYTYLQSDCNQAIGRILPALPSSALCFCFVDPFGWEIHFSSIKRLTQSRRLDLAITFHSGSLRRVARTAPAKLDLFFPSPAWRNAYGEATHKSRAALDIYEGGLRGLGYEDFRDYVLVRNSRSVPLYHLLFASKDVKGGEFWDKISQKSLSGQLRLFREETDTKYSP